MHSALPCSCRNELDDFARGLQMRRGPKAPRFFMKGHELTLDPTALEFRFEVAKALAREAGAVAKRRFLDRSSFTVGLKGPQDFLTEVDGEVEQLIAKRILRLFPQDGFIGEEGAGRKSASDTPVWVVDPIDGTTNFAHNIPHWCISIAAVVGLEVEVGVIYDPMHDELYAARRGAGRASTAQKSNRPTLSS